MSYADFSDGYNSNGDRFVRSDVHLKDDKVESSELARQFAILVMKTYPKAFEKDLILVNLVYGYDIGLSSWSNVKQYEFTPCQFNDLVQNESEVIKSELDIPERLRLLQSSNYSELDLYYSTLQKNYEDGTATEDDLYYGFRELYDEKESNQKYFNGWVMNNLNSYAAITARGAYYYRMGKESRGGKFSNKTPNCKFAQMQYYLEKAKSDLDMSRTMTKKPYITILYLLNMAKFNQSKNELRSLLDEGNSIAPDNWFVRYRYMHSITPRWGGSYEMMHAFLKESAEQGVSEENLAKLESEIYSDQVEMEDDQQNKDQALANLKSNIEKSLLNGWKPLDSVLITYAREAIHRRAYDDAFIALEILAKDKTLDAWIYSNLSYIYQRKNQPILAWKMANISANKGDAWAQYNVGYHLYKGSPELNLTADKTAGLIWVQKSANQGFKDAVYFLAHDEADR